MFTCLNTYVWSDSKIKKNARSVKIDVEAHKKKEISEFCEMG